MASGVYRLFWGGVLRPEEIFSASTRLQKSKRLRLCSSFRRVLRPQSVASAYYFSNLLSKHHNDLHFKSLTILLLILPLPKQTNDDIDT